MKKVKPKAKATAKKSAKSMKKVEENADLAKARKDIAGLVGSEAVNMARAVVDEALKGELAPVKYLFEATGLYPTPAEETESAPQEDSLARTLLRRLGMPEEPVVSESEPARKSGRASLNATNESSDLHRESPESALAKAVGSGEE